MNMSPVLKSWQAAFAAQANASAMQREAFTQFLAQGLPTTKLDAWKYTDLRRLAMKQFRLGTAEGISDYLSPLLPLKPDLTFIDGTLRPSLPLWERDGERGFFFSSTPISSPSPQRSAAQDVRMARAHGSAGAAPTKGEGAKTDAFVLLNEAFATTLTISIPDNQTLDHPIYLAHIWTAHANGAMSHPRIDIKLGRHSKATLVEHHIGLNSETNLTNTVINIDVGDHAELEHIRVQDDAPSNFNIGSVHATVAKAARYLSHHYVIGGELARTDIHVELAGAEAHTELHGLVFAKDTQHLDVRTVITHQVPNTTSIEDYRGIADHRGRVVFNGKVIVAKDAQKTDAKQSSRNLLLSPQAEIDTRPELEIYANDVKCAHGATVGQLDATALFYLQSRGIARDEARVLLTHAFAAEVIERIPVPTVRDHVLSRLMSRMRTEATL